MGGKGKSKVAKWKEKRNIREMDEDKCMVKVEKMEDDVGV